MVKSRSWIVLFRVGITERDLFQLYLSTARQIRDRHAAFKTEGLRDVKIFPNRVEIKASPYAKLQTHSGYR
jgi:hypothetical protein